MSKIIVFLAIAVAACRAAPGGGTRCGETPSNIFKCLNDPTVMTVSHQCRRMLSQCDKLNCMFSESEWMNGTSVDKKKVTYYFDQYADRSPEWSPAVQHLKAACLGDELKAQGPLLNCPAYDIMHCAMTSFIKQATPSQWSTSAECSYPRAYAATCPVCPADCFAAQVPIGSCNACVTLPRSP